MDSQHYKKLEQVIVGGIIKFIHAVLACRENTERNAGPFPPFNLRSARQAVIVCTNFFFVQGEYCDLLHFLVWRLMVLKQLEKKTKNDIAAFNEQSSCAVMHDWRKPEDDKWYF